MNCNWKVDIKSALNGLLIGGILTIPYFIWHSFWFLCIGIIVFSLSLIYIGLTFFKRNDGGYFVSIGFVLGFLISIICLFWHDQRFITPSGKKQHIYSDCYSLTKSKKVKMVTEAEGFFHWTFSDCKICEQRKVEEIRLKKETKMQLTEEKKEEKRQELIEYLQDLIDDLNNGADPDMLERRLHSDWDEEDEDDDDYVPGEPPRYQ